MSKSKPVRYVTEDDVKQALNIDSFRNISKDKIMEFASMIPYVDKDVALAIVGQFPRFADFGEITISHYTGLCNTILEHNKASQKDVVIGYQTILNALAKRMDKENITEQEVKSITEDMISVADRIAAAEVKNKKFYQKIAIGAGIVITFLGGVAAAILGTNSKVGGAGDLPHLSDDEPIDGEFTDIDEI